VSSLLETHDLTVRFGGLVAVSKVELSVKEGEILGVIGPNGAGKTTFINLVTGHVRPTHGQVCFEGRDVTGMRPWNLASMGIARTFQVTKPFRGMTVQENVAVASMFGTAKLRSVKKALTAAQEMLERVGLGKRSSALATELSIVDLKRLELAKAMATRPRLLLLDEVMAGLRPAEVDLASEQILALRSEGISVMAVEHVMKAIVAISDRVFVMHQGEKLTEGPVAEVLSDERVIEAYLGERYARRHRGG
jgi:branched-chain amino acid transport system ATP-binding protein